ncbi:hypothetical protein KFE25_012576 [Diacronema lutheri]|uniref:G domain-containing protein n=2 Tax=Diacronema lutheri TaxID=2081491 RepID=A0A8J5XE50_DIALT|nr:hypothetical protein KFE25_012576 [Diacronema lutheri]
MLKRGQERGSKGKPKKGSESHLGKALANQQRAVQRVHQLVARTDETAEWERGKSKLRSVTDCDDLEDFMAQATMANTDFTATERAHTVILKSAVVQSARAERAPVHQALLRVPRRPRWGVATTAEELTQLEHAAFLEWRRGLANMEESGALLTPFERNLEVWRQLWRVLERSDLVVQIVDARNPLFFKCDDLDEYVAELPGPLAPAQPRAPLPAVGEEAEGDGDGVVDGTETPPPGAAAAAPPADGDERAARVASPLSAGTVGRLAKRSLLLLNKADLLPAELRARWAAYFAQRGVRFVFFSALKAEEEMVAAQRQYAAALRALGDAEPLGRPADARENGGDEPAPSWRQPVDGEPSATAPAAEPGAPEADRAPPCLPFAAEHVYSRDELLRLLLEVCPQRHVAEDDSVSVAGGAPASSRPYRFNVGFVGYPNVGKSSTINTLVADKKVSVSATPGKTKHFQTLSCPDEPELRICDCPGLVFPALAGSKAQMLCDGVLPIDQLRDPAPALDELVSRVPRRELERTYALTLALRLDGDDPEPLSPAHELLIAYGLVHSFTTKGGAIDTSRAARIMLKDLVGGKLRHWTTPPDGLESHDELRFAGADAPTDEELALHAAGRRPITAERYVKDSRFDAQEGVRAVTGGDLGKGGVGGGGLAAGAKGGKAARRRQADAADAARRAAAAAGAIGSRLPDRMVATGAAVD